METLYVEILDHNPLRCRNPQLGEFGELPKELPPGPPPAVLAFDGWAPALDERISSHADDVVGLLHHGSEWEYRLHRAYTDEPTPQGGLRQVLQVFFVGVRNS